MRNRIPASTYELNLTNKCNLACSYCFEKDKGNCSLNVEDLNDIIQNPLTTKFYLFGGEPMMHPEFHIDLYNKLMETNMPNALKEELWKSAASSTTNGTRLHEFPEFYEQYGLTFQVSVDGPKEVHDKNRIYRSGKGSFDKIMENYDTLKKKNVPSALHGVVSKNTLPHLFEINKFFFEMIDKYDGRKAAIKSFSRNTFMFVIEDGYTDEDIDLAIEQYEKTFEWLKSFLSEEEYKECILSASSKTGSLCGAGHNLLVLGVDGNIYPCHRGYGYAGKDKASVSFGDSFTDNPTNIQIYNNYFRNVRRESTFSPNELPIDWGNDVFTPQVNFCPATFKEVCDTVFYMPPVYYVFMMELGNYLMSKAIEEGFTLKDIASYIGRVVYTEEENNG